MKRAMASERYDNLTSRTSELAVRAQNLKRQIEATEQGSLANTMYNALQVAKEVGVAEPGDLVVLTAGDPQTSPRLGDYTTSTNVAMICQVQ